MTNTSSGDLFDKPKTATDLLVALEHYKAGHMTKAKLIEEWTGHKWSSEELTLWARWQFRNVFPKEGKQGEG